MGERNRKNPNQNQNSKLHNSQLMVKLFWLRMMMEKRDFLIEGSLMTMKKKLELLVLLHQKNCGNWW